MVFYYTIRGGQCLNDNSHINLTSFDIICYVGRDKHENEYLIQYGWPGDIWFHVSALSSAHVYFRLKKITNSTAKGYIPIDDLPTDSVYDMMQICKNNSIAGCKLSSCKIVYTPHSNLKKTFEMESGAVTYFDTKICRYGRCEKDRPRVKELEKTKSDDIKVDYYQEMKDNERKIVEEKKKIRMMKSDEGGDDADLMYNPIQEDLMATERKATREGDESSGLDVGLLSLQDLSFTPMSISSTSTAPTNVVDLTKIPIWMQEESSRKLEPLVNVRFLRERGYTNSEAAAAWNTTKSRIVALKKLYMSSVDNNDASESTDMDIPEEVTQARLEEKEVLLAIYGEDDRAVFSNLEDPSILDIALPIESYEAPHRYESDLSDIPPPLMLEVYADNSIAPLYPNEPPILAVLGGGLPESRLKMLTNRIRAEAMIQAQEAPGEPQIFNLVAFVGEEAENIVREEGKEIDSERKKRMEAERAATAKQREAEAEIRKNKALENPSSLGLGGAFHNEMERRDYAQQVIGASGNGKLTRDVAKGRKQYDSGVSNQSLCNDLFGL